MRIGFLQSVVVISAQDGLDRGEVITHQAIFELDDIAMRDPLQDRDLRFQVLE